MAKFYFDATDMTDEELERLKQNSQEMANRYGIIVKIATAKGEVRVREERNDQYSEYIARMGK